MANLRELSLLLYTNSRLLIQAIQSRLNEFEITYPQYLTLAVLWEEDGQYVNQIGQKLALDSGTLTPLIKKLESHNYVKRVRSEEDERKVKVELTYPGKTLQSKINAALHRLEIDFGGEENIEVGTFITAMELLQGKIKGFQEEENKD
ncbi:MarR family winged helix-turn-helix transcriptional regulator [Algoriphagus sp. PAP.12]|jgi:DNA-binding MarR family transcriptional regulator|uniref:MarR family winged helix-turn-helix transcriptional regulator n=1 Tax=Algoriphagus sp. PAP.12 TaxID=2996678 RepID=UPI00227A1389|nr:MarR family transcriptional regulator [Algoriphagus sp. PAP.12]